MRRRKAKWAGTASWAAVALSWVPAASAGPQVGTVTAVQGEVKIFSHPSKDEAKGPPPHAKFEDTVYSVRDARAGDRVEKQNLLRTHPGAKSRVVFDNGDQFHLGPATFYRIDWDRDEATASPVLELRYGKARFVIAKDGPRARFKVRTKTAVMGVRGTDFFVAVNEETGATETAALRGSVEVQAETVAAEGAPAAAEPAAKAVSAGETATVETAEVTVHRTTQPELQSVQRNSTVQAPEAVPAEAVETVQTLEIAAAKTTLADIQAADPKLAERLQAPEGEAAPSVDALNAAAVDALAAEAPKEQAALGPISDESLEKKGEAVSVQDASSSAAKEEEPTFPWLWIGAKGGVADATLGAYPTGQSESLSSPQLGVIGELEVGRNLSLVAELFPGATHGGVNRNPTPTSSSSSSSGSSSGNPDLEYALKYTDLVFTLRPGIPFGTTRGFGIHAITGFRIGLLGSATRTDGNDVDTDVTTQFKNNTFSVVFGVGVGFRPARRLKLTFEYRFMNSLGDVTDIVSSGLQPASAQARLIAAGLELGLL